MRPRKAFFQLDPLSRAIARDAVLKAQKRATGASGTPSRVAAAAEPPEFLTTMPGIPITEVGEDWHTSTGVFTFTEDDLAAAVAAVDDPAIKSPRLKLGHVDPRFDGDPVFGKFVNLRLENNNQTLVGDLVGVPKWLADIMPTAWPNRSLEADYDVQTKTGNTHQFVISAVAALGVYLPAVTTLDDLKTLYEEGEGVEVEVAASGRHVMATRGGQMEGSVAASLPVEDVRRAYYEQLGPDQTWWWIRTMLIDPTDLIVDDDEGGLFRVPFEVSGSDITFEDPKPVEIEYVDVDSSSVAATAAIYASRSESRPETRDKEDQVELNAEQLQKLGLSEDASQEEIDAKLDELTAETPPAEDPPAETPPAETPPAEDPPAEDPPKEDPTADPNAEEAVAASGGPVPVDPDALAELQRQAAMGVQARQQQLNGERDRILAKAVEDGKIPPASKDHYKTLWDKDPKGTSETLASLTPGIIPTDERGGTPPEEQLQAEAYPAGWLPEVQRQAESGERVTQEVGQ